MWILLEFSKIKLRNGFSVQTVGKRTGRVGRGEGVGGGWSAGGGACRRFRMTLGTFQRPGMVPKHPAGVQESIWGKWKNRFREIFGSDFQDFVLGT